LFLSPFVVGVLSRVDPINILDERGEGGEDDDDDDDDDEVDDDGRVRILPVVAVGASASARSLTGRRAAAAATMPRMDLIICRGWI
jgi:hypothetical protein